MRITGTFASASPATAPTKIPPSTAGKSHYRSRSSGDPLNPLPASLQRLADRAEALNLLVVDVVERMKTASGGHHRQSDAPLEHVFPFALKLHGERIVKRTHPSTNQLGEV